tara:strand:+ start:19721 stop:20503 length:783 start_codon:yes stop_codon:yes gene_type:complete
MIKVSNDYDSQTIRNFEISSQKYTVRLAQNREEIEKALKLRFVVFNVELGEGLEESYVNKLDEDRYDEFCYHLIIIENATKGVVGTYRIQDSDSAAEGFGFYTENEFDLSSFPDIIRTDAFELGRACIDIRHRNGRVLYMLWKGIAKFMNLLNKKYLFGCCSITSQNPSEGLAVYEHLKMGGFVSDTYFAEVTPNYECLSFIDSPCSDLKVEIPQLFKLYLELGCKVCSKPALDREFKTIDFLILLNLNSFSRESRALFL